MMEHVGIGHFDEYFSKIRELLTPDGYAFVHCIGRIRRQAPRARSSANTFSPAAITPCRKSLPPPSDRDCGADMEVLRLHY